MIFIEVFAGTARLSKAVKEIGCQAMPVDKTADRSSQIHICIYDLADDSQCDDLLSFIDHNHENIIWIHCAPACGTASRAREKALPNLTAKGYHVAKPLRSEEYPHGVPGLSNTDKIRTETANLVYANTAKIIRLAFGLQIQCSLENPLNSLFWAVPEIQSVLAEIQGHDVIFDNCCHGGKRAKATRWWSIFSWFDSLSMRCPGTHQHESWKPQLVDGRLVYPTAEEAAYPTLLCTRLADILKCHLEAKGFVQPQYLQQQKGQTSMHRFLLDMLPRGRKFKPLVSLYCKYVLFVHLLDEDVNSIQHSLPKGWSSTSRRILKRGDIRAEYPSLFLSKTQLQTEKTASYDYDFFFSVNARAMLWSENEASDSVPFDLETIGVPRDPMDFLQEAVKVGHPRSMAIHLPENVVKVLETCCNGTLFELAKHRVQYLWHWSNRAKELVGKEQELKDGMQVYLKELMAKKRLTLFGEMLAACDYPDRNLIEDLKNGFPLTGWLESSNVFPKNIKRPQYSLQTLVSVSKGLNKLILKQLSMADDDDISRQVWKLTKEEIDAGFVWLDESQDAEDHCLAKRFGLQQKNKVRLIDDLSIGGINKAIGVVEKYKVHCIDEIAAYLCYMMTEARRSGRTLDLMGRAYDLKNAFKQFGVTPRDRDLIRIAVRNTDEGKTSFRGLNSLPFGAVGSVGGFLRVSIAVWYLGVTQLHLPWCAYFDDYTIFCEKRLASNTSLAVETFFDLIGLDFAKEGSKAMQFDYKFKTLGVELDLGSASSGVVKISHTESRVSELSELLNGFLVDKAITAKQAESLRGRLHWFESFAFGRLANQAIAKLGEYAYSQESKLKLKEEDLQVLEFLKNRVLTAPPILLSPSCLESWVIFTDGACEGSDHSEGSVGGVLVNPLGKVVCFFGEQVPSEIMDLLGYSKNPIYEIELMPVFLATLVWFESLKFSQTVFYVDNDAARFSLIKGVASTKVGKCIMKNFVTLELEGQIKSWFSRVPTSSNIADDPSRLKFASLEALGASRVKISWSKVREMLA